ncbi:MAG: S26 family signal peptidase [Planctomycetota bacterium]
MTPELPNSTPDKLGTPDPHPHRHESEGVKETIESIVIALILAFVFRAFVVEAFVIPTGSMAPTLYGAHGTIVCEDCGTEFAYGLRDLDDQRPMRLVSAAEAAVCPNCAHVNTDLPLSDHKRNAEKGDRILVLKWPLDIGGKWLDPARWDVTVFKDPSDGATNFIKRMVGLPNEVLMIVDGDVYTVPTGKLSPESLTELERLVHEKHEFIEGSRRGRLPSPSDSVLAELDSKLRITRKSSEAQRMLWFNVYNHDFPPRRLDADQPRWAPAEGGNSGWSAPWRRLRFEDRGIYSDYLELKNANFDAVVAYNVFERTAPPVSDQRVSFVVKPEAPEGLLRVRLEKLGRAFLANVRMDGTVSLLESPAPPGNLKPINLSVTLPAFGVGEAVEVSFENVDYRLAVSVAGREVLVSSDDPNSPGYYAPDVSALRKMYRPSVAVAPRIYGEQGRFELSHVQVQRDEYYFTETRANVLPALSWAPREGWASRQSPMLLRDGEYFMLGDNTAASKDSRLWDVRGKHLIERREAFQLGTVPRDQLIGKAFFVYWPSGQRLPWLPSVGAWHWPIVPDVGRMRWIR